MNMPSEIYHCLTAIIEIDGALFSHYFSVPENFQRADLLELIREEEILKFSSDVGGKIRGYTVEKRVKLSDDGVNRVIEILEKSSFNSELIPINSENDQPTGFLGSYGVWASLHKDCQRLERSGNLRLLHVTRKDADRSVKFDGL